MGVIAGTPGRDGVQQQDEWKCIGDIGVDGGDDQLIAEIEADQGNKNEESPAHGHEVAAVVQKVKDSLPARCGGVEDGKLA